ncbi:MAG: SDR family oxidoreductase [Pirellulales bacterium]|nr:SDR family oxidoreductase [Pirellulales bacterium]
MTSNHDRSRLTLVLRGLLAEPTDDADRPFCPGILTRVDSPAGGANDRMLSVDALGPELSEENVKSRLLTAIEAHVASHGCRPDIVRVEDGRAFRMERSRPNSTRPLAGRVALVTGAAGAIGYGICLELLAAGCHVAATDLAGERLDRFAADLRKNAPDRVLGVALDVTQADSVAQAFDDVAAVWGGVDLVVHNAGIALVAHLKELDLESFRRLERVNVEGTLLVLQEAQRVFLAQGIGGDIVIMSTKNVPCPGAGFGAYSATKAACHQLGRIASLEMAADGIRVNMVAPDAVFAEGAYKSGLWEEVGPGRMKARGLDEAGLHEYYRNRNLLKARVTGRHVARAVLFFATRQTPTTGATIPVDGGLPDATPR